MKKVDTYLMREVTKNLLKDIVKGNVDQRVFSLQHGYVEGEITRAQLYDEIDYLEMLHRDIKELIDKK